MYGNGRTYGLRTEVMGSDTRTPALRACPGGECARKRECVRYLNRADAAAEIYRVAPWRHEIVRDEQGRKTGEQQVCDVFVKRTTES